ncbi:metabotropic glutamate receptor 3 [Hydra vulgaris]|uniref:Metabotropic glutamate receptor 3 n=1 Tax=Hydra vulgaris TaxID=6087 RepID=A0ABM4BCN6_HYDVU
MFVWFYFRQLHFLLEVLTCTVADQLYSTRCQHIQNYVIADATSSTRLTSITSGNYTIQAIITITGNTFCSIVSRSGLVRQYAIEYALYNAYKKINNSQRAKIGLRIDDDCASLPITMSRGIELASMLRESSVCQKSFLHCSRKSQESPNDIQTPIGLIGTSLSLTTIPLATLTSLYRIPQISPGASSSLLSKTDLYKSFLRTIPSDINQVSVMLDIIETFRWNFIIAVGSDDDYGKLAIFELETRARMRNICITETVYVPFKSPNTEKSVKNLMELIINKPKAKVVILFLYVIDLGDLILNEAKKRGVQRIWLTSDAWVTAAESLNVTLNNQTHGIISVSPKRYELPEFVQFMENEIKSNFVCNMWLKNYLKNNFNCEPNNISSNKETLFGYNNCSVDVKNVMKELSSPVGKITNLIDAVTALVLSIYKFLEINCIKDKDCSISAIAPLDLNAVVRNISFKNSMGEIIEFDQSGEPTYVLYTIDNLQLLNGQLKYISIGNWSNKRTKRLMIEKSIVKWPFWFKRQPEQDYPNSRCSEDCRKGQFYTAKTGCCWICENCANNHYSDTVMANKCLPCEAGYYTRDHTTCLVTRTYWRSYNDAEGAALVIANSIGLLLTILFGFILHKFSHLIITDEPSPHMISFGCIILVLTFSFGFLNVVEPSFYLCKAKSAGFQFLFMTISSFLLIKTKLIAEFLKRKSKFQLFASQMLLVAFLLLVQICIITAYFVIDSGEAAVKNQPVNNGSLLEKTCNVELTPTKLVSILLPIILLTISTIFAFRDRNSRHTLYEPKFLCFACAALSIITAAFLSTFKLLNGNLKTLVLAFSANVSGFILMICFILPKIYLAQTRFFNISSLRNVLSPFPTSENEIKMQKNTIANNNNVVPNENNILPKKKLNENNVLPKNSFELLNKNVVSNNFNT